MFSLKNKSKGFTIVELLIVIVVIGILATLVIVTFTGIQQKARNSQRETDINALTSHVEAFYAQYGFYPAGADMTNATFISTYMKGLDPEAARDPKQAAGATLSSSAVAATVFQYSYVATGTSCTTTALATTGDPIDTGCEGFTLTAHRENGDDYVKSSNT